MARRYVFESVLKKVVIKVEKVKKKWKKFKKALYFSFKSL